MLFPRKQEQITKDLCTMCRSLVIFLRAVGRHGAVLCLEKCMQICILGSAFWLADRCSVDWR